MKKEIMVAGFGGQGVMSIGKLLVEAGVKEDMDVSWVPSYGPEMRGGTANCSVILSDKPIGSPLVYNPSELIAMNEPSLAKFENDVVPSGSIFINSTIIKEAVERSDVQVYSVPCDSIALDLGNIKAANMVMLGAFVAATDSLKMSTLQSMVQHMFTGSKEKLAVLNMKALERGALCINKTT